MSPPLADLDTCGCCEPRSDATPARVWNRPGLSHISYRIGTYSSFRQAMVEDVRRQAPLRDLTTRADDDYGIALFDLWAYIADILTFYQERIANECYLRTSVLRESVLRAAALLGYRPAAGLAATAELTFALERGKELTIPAGLRIQSVPGPEEKPQKFETSQPLAARAAVNRLRALPPTQTITPLAVGAVAATVNPPDADRVRELLSSGMGLVLSGPQATVEEKTVVALEDDEDLLRLEWEPPVRQAGRTSVRALRRKLRLFGVDAPPTYLRQYVTTGTVGAGEVRFELEQLHHAAATTSDPYSTQVPAATFVQLNGVVEDLHPGTQVMIVGGSQPVVRTITGVRTVAAQHGPLAGPATELEFGTPSLPVLDRRTAAVYELMGEVSLWDRRFPATITGTQVLVPLEPGVELEDGRPIVLEDGDGPPHVAEVVRTAAVNRYGGSANDHLEVEFAPGLTRSLTRETATLSGNVAEATHGETIARELLGTGDAAIPFQQFLLKERPMTHVPRPGAPNGAAPTLEVRVAGLAWRLEQQRFGLAPDDRVFTAGADDEQKTTVEFGDGRNGARLPTGAEVIARYRKGLGRDGNVRAGTLTTLLTKPTGLRSATNPLPAVGGSDPETLEVARTSAPETVRTLGRIVSLRDFEDAARESALVAKARATWAWNGDEEAVHLTVAGDAGAHVTGTAYRDLRADLDARRDPFRRLILVDYTEIPLRIEAVIVEHDPDRLADDVVAAAKGVLQDHFAFERRAFGGPVHASEVFAVLGGALGVRGVDVNRLSYARETDRVAHATSTAAVQPHLRIDFDELAVLDPADAVVTAA